MELLPHRSVSSTATDTNNLSNIIDRSNTTPDPAHQHKSTVQSLGQDTDVEESIAALNISEGVETCSKTTDAQLKETVNKDQDNIAPTSKHFIYMYMTV